MGQFFLCKILNLLPMFIVAWLSVALIQSAADLANPLHKRLLLLYGN